MTRVRIQVPVDVDVTEEVIDVARAASELAKRVRGSGVVDAVSELVGAVRRARRPRRR